MSEKAISYTAKFSVNSYTVNLDCDILKGSVTGGGNYEYGSSVTIVATAKTGYTFVGWYDDDALVSDQAEYTITKISQNVTYIAKFSANKHTVIVECNSTQGSVTGGGNYDYGSSVAIKAIANDGYTFIGWYDGETLISSNSEYNFILGDSDIVYTAKFSVNSYTVNLDCDMLKGSVTGGGNYEYGSSVTIVATAKTGYSFVGWYEEERLISNEAEYTFNVPTNVTYIAKFDIDPVLQMFNVSIFDNGEIIINGLKDEFKDVDEIIVPNIVSRIDNSAFYGCSKLKNVTIPNSVTSIGESAFLDCSSLTSVTIPDSVTSIGKQAFGGCISLTSITLPFVGAELGDTTDMHIGYIFSRVPESLKEVIITGGESIGNFAFADCSSIASVTIPNSVKSIGNQAFAGCISLTSITIPNSVKSIGGGAFSYCSDLTSVTIPDSVTSIGERAFADCSGLTSVTISDSVTSIGWGAFEDCSNLTSVTIPDSVKSIGERAFADCSGLTSVTIGSGVTSIGSGSFEGCSGLTSLTLSSGVSSIGGSAFAGCISLTSITIPNSVTSIGYGAFNNCSSLASVIIPDSVTSISSYAFYNCSGLTSVIIPDSVTSIGDYAFDGCSSLTSVTIPDSVTSIANYAFYGCRGLTSVTIGSGVTSIGTYAFSGCYALAEVYNLSSLNIIKGSTNYGYVAYYALDVYNSLSEPSRLTEKDGMIFHINGENVTLVNYIGNETKIIIPNNITKIGNGAFYNCSSLTNVTIPNSVTSIGEYAFRYCRGLTSVIFENTSGWFVSGSYDATNGLDATVTSPSENAKYLKDTYYDCYWKRK